MYQFAYSEILDDSPDTMRDGERRAFDHAIALLEAAERAGPRSMEAIEALHFVRRLWSVLLDDLVAPENALTEELRAGLISIGIWVIREAERIRLEEVESFAGIIDINRTIRAGLEGQA
ncbi:flagellar biosynthesis regulator FlaF [Faunimonas sp. B44]|uniref:flagellar biosynthesis regulator FlaF n=1 Tax=Faunimonas sp. B44 TaxID=3461493 RepID=UPI004043ABCA